MAATQRWGFDFVRGKPLEDTKLFLWERVPPTNDIPEMYTLSRAAHIRHIEADHQMRSPSKRRQYRTTSYIDLLDERSEQSNNHIAVSNVLDLSFEEDVDAGHSSASSCDEESFDERTSGHHEKMLIDTANDTLNCSSGSSNSSILLNASTIDNSQTHDVRLTALPTIVSVPKPAPVAVPSTSVSVRRANNNTATTNSQCNRTSCRTTTNTVARNLRSSPRNREKRQPKITGTFCRSFDSTWIFFRWNEKKKKKDKWRRKSMYDAAHQWRWPLRMKAISHNQQNPNPSPHYSKVTVCSNHSYAAVLPWQVSWKCN